MDPELLDLLACPKCRGNLTPVPSVPPVLVVEPPAGEEAVKNIQGLACAACNVVYPVEDSIPVLLPEAAVPAAEWERRPRP